MTDIILTRGASRAVLGAGAPYVLCEVDGLFDPAEYEVRTIRRPGQDGAVITAASFAPRGITITLHVVGDTAAAHRVALSVLLRLARPARAPLLLTAGDRRLEVVPDETPSVSMIAPCASKVELAVTAYDPLYEAVQEQIKNAFGWTKLLFFPAHLHSAWTFGERVKSSSINVRNDGDADAAFRLVLRAAGRVVDPYVRAVGREKSIQLTTKMVAGDVITITSGGGTLTVVRHRGVDDADLIGRTDIRSEPFALLPGDNLLKIGAAEGEASLSAAVYHRPRYTAVI